MGARSEFDGKLAGSERILTFKACAARFTLEEARRKERAFETLEAKITELWGRLNAATSRFLMLAAEFDHAKAYERHGLANTAQWLNWQCGIGPVAAREKVRVARALEQLPAISDAFAKGESPYGLRATDDRLFVFTRPDGRRVEPNGVNCFRGNILALHQLNRAAGLEITSETARCQWRGETMDYSHAIESMQFLDSKAPAPVLHGTA